MTDIPPADYTSKRVMCGHCDNAWRIAKLHLKIMHNGSEAFVWICTTCDMTVTIKNILWIPTDKVVANLTRTQLNGLPLLMPTSYSRCVKCGSRYAENHHWAPRAIFDDAEDWPQDYLCKVCHDTWHEKMKTP